jgi:hypothetical protein
VPGFRTEQSVTTSALAQIIEHDLQQIAEAFVDAEVKVLEGEPAETILDLATGSGVDCIVLAPHRLAITHKWILVQSLLRAGYLRGGAAPSI